VKDNRVARSILHNLLEPPLDFPLPAFAALRSADYGRSAAGAARHYVATAHVSHSAMPSGISSRRAQ
jgi:hypothetical protein